MANIAPVISSHDCNFTAFSESHAEIKQNKIGDFKNAELKLKMITCKLSKRKLCFESHTDNTKRLATHLAEIANNQHRMAAEIFQKTWLLFSRPCRCCYSRQGFDMLGLYLKGLYLAKWVRRVEDQTPFACYIKRKGNLL